MNIGFLSVHNPFDRNSFSGTTYHAYEALQRLPGVNVTVLGSRYHFQEKVRCLALKVFSKLSGGRLKCPTIVHQKIFRSFLSEIERDLSKQKIDVVICLVSSGLVSELSPDTYPPFILVTDATVSFLEEAYGYPIEFTDYQHEYQAIQKASRVVFSSDFMADRARAEYADLLSRCPDKICVAPFGLNMTLVPEKVETPGTEGQINLLFVGKEWYRKGGDIALETLRYLLSNDIDAHLTIIGCTPDIPTEEPNITVIPYLNKNNFEQRQQYFHILNRSHFLLLPTLADCTPMVIAEANAFGVPALVSDVGGIGTLVKPGLNGYLLPSTAGGAEYADVAAQIFEDLPAYYYLSRASRREYETRLNWDAWAKQICDLSTTLGTFSTDTAKVPILWSDAAAKRQRLQ